MDYYTKIDFIHKTQRVINLYCKVNKINKYITRKVLKDSNSIKYDVFLLDINKLFEHSDYFKTLKKREIFDKRGNKLSSWYDERDYWMNSAHLQYMAVSNFIYSIIHDKNDRLKVDDFFEINNIYGELKRKIKRKQ